ncbi:MAG: CRISPR-associated endonuclease/helicase Cas3 [Halanaerobiales bacterium]|nr:CRISPR-associated endonuclease/helicase Cas3 [Halanaerobiales bacterium]
MLYRYKGYKSITFVQLLESILTNNNRSIKKFNNICNSIIVLDEVQAIPHKYWLLIKRVFREIADQFNCYFIFVTATMPLIFNEEKGEIKELATDKVEYFMICDRIELDLSNYREEIDLDIFKKIIEADLKTEYPEKSFLFILNTIKSSIEIYNFIKHDLEYKNVIYLSKNLVTKELTKRIEKIKNADEPLIVVSTQLVEAGVDIDFDRVYRDFAPLDSINQSCGRCNVW